MYLYFTTSSSERATPQPLVQGHSNGSRVLVANKDYSRRWNTSKNSYYSFLFLLHAQYFSCYSLWCIFSSLSLFLLRWIASVSLIAAILVKLPLFHGRKERRSPFQCHESLQQLAPMFHSSQSKETMATVFSSFLFVLTFDSLLCTRSFVKGARCQQAQLLVAFDEPVHLRLLQKWCATV